MRQGLPIFCVVVVPAGRRCERGHELLCPFLFCALECETDNADRFGDARRRQLLGCLVGGHTYVFLIARAGLLTIGDDDYRSAANSFQISRCLPERVEQWGIAAGLQMVDCRENALAIKLLDWNE